MGVSTAGAARHAFAVVNGPPRHVLHSVLEAASKVEANPDELCTAEHPLVHLKSMSRAHRDRAMREGTASER